MNLTHAIKQLSGEAADARDLTEQDAHQLLAGMLDGGVAELELGALLALLEHKPVTLAELLGYASALAERCSRIRPPARSARPVVFASYHGMREQPHLLPLVALKLQRLGVPVLVHGALDGGGGVAVAYVFRELGVLPCASLGQAQAKMEEGGLAFVPTAVLAPGLAGLLALRGRLGFSGFARMLARLLVPFETEALQIVAAGDPAESALLREFLVVRDWNALLLEGAEGEGFADPQRRPCIEYFAMGERRVLFDAETATLKHATTLPDAVDAQTTAAWILRALAGEAPIPLPLVNQLACCLYGTGYTDDLNQAKAIVAVETGSLAAA